MDHPTRETAMQLISMKDALEDELRELMEVLKKNNTDMDQPLVDREGYPRADIDVYQVRTARHKIICLKNDLRDLTRKIEEAIHNLHAQQREGLGFSDGHKDLSELSELDAPFAKIGTVSEGSPADKAGLKCDDLVLRFGSVRASNYGSLQDLAGVVQHRINCEIPVYVRRGERNLAITLIPRTWSGRGVIGCTFLPQDNVDR